MCTAGGFDSFIIRGPDFYDMYFWTVTENSDGSQTIVTVAKTRFRELLREAARQAGYNIVAANEYNNDDNSEPSHVRIASVHGLGEGELLDERHATFYTTEVNTRSSLTEEEEEHL